MPISGFTEGEATCTACKEVIDGFDIGEEAVLGRSKTLITIEQRYGYCDDSDGKRHGLVWVYDALEYPHTIMVSAHEINSIAQPIAP